jgi:phage terminase small subunit
MLFYADLISDIMYNVKKHPRETKGVFLVYERQVNFMTDNQKKFCDEYLIDTNATRAYKVAYPHVKSDDAARACASRLLTKDNIKSYIDEQLDKLSSEKVADAKEVMEYLTSVMRGETEDEVLRFIGDGYQEKTHLQTNVKDRTKAAELLGKRYGLFKESMTVDVEPVVIVNDLKE